MAAEEATLDTTHTSVRPPRTRTGRPCSTQTPPSPTQGSRRSEYTARAALVQKARPTVSAATSPREVLTETIPLTAFPDSYV